jgi:Flp pilus assembly protein TadG
VEFTLIAPVLLSLFIFSIDAGSAILVYTQMGTAAREAARQAVLEANVKNNDKPECNPAACNVPGVLPQVTSLTSVIPWGVNVVYNYSTTNATNPSYLGSYTPNADVTKPGTVQLKSDASNGTIYVFIYQIGASTQPSGAPRWACPPPGCNDEPYTARTRGHQTVVVDMKMKWLPVTMNALGIRTPIVLDAQTVERMEW